MFTFPDELSKRKIIMWIASGISLLVAIRLVYELWVLGGLYYIAVPFFELFEMLLWDRNAELSGIEAIVRLMAAMTVVFIVPVLPIILIMVIYGWLMYNYKQEESFLKWFSERIISELILGTILSLIEFITGGSDKK